MGNAWRQAEKDREMEESSGFAGGRVCVDAMHLSREGGEGSSLQGEMLNSVSRTWNLRSL